MNMTSLQLPKPEYRRQVGSEWSSTIDRSLPEFPGWEYRPQYYDSYGVYLWASRPVQNGFVLMEQNRTAEYWLELDHWDMTKAEVGRVMSARERGGHQKVRVAEIATDGATTWVRGEWIGEGSYLPVGEFLSDLDRAAHKMGAPV